MQSEKHDLLPIGIDGLLQIGKQVEMEACSRRANGSGPQPTLSFFPSGFDAKLYAQNDSVDGIAALDCPQPDIDAEIWIQDIPVGFQIRVNAPNEPQP